MLVGNLGGVMNKAISFIVVAIFLVIVPTITASAQDSRASLGGRVLDPQGSVIPAAQVLVTAEGTGVKQNTITNDHGNWIVQFLIPGPYSVAVTANGFKRTE